jgi:hypothetical protein
MAETFMINFQWDEYVIQLLAAGDRIRGLQTAQRYTFERGGMVHNWIVAASGFFRGSALVESALATGPFRLVKPILPLWGMVAP